MTKALRCPNPTPFSRLKETVTLPTRQSGREGLFSLYDDYPVPSYGRPASFSADCHALTYVFSRARISQQEPTILGQGRGLEVFRQVVQPFLILFLEFRRGLDRVRPALRP